MLITSKKQKNKKPFIATLGLVIDQKPVSVTSQEDA